MTRPATELYSRLVHAQPSPFSEGQALLSMPAGRDLVTTVDTLVGGVHFPVDTPAKAIGHKALAVNLSDLAAMGAEPAWATLVLVVPDEQSEPWLEAFADGVQALATDYGLEIACVMRRTAELAITIEAYGLIEPGAGLRRDGAQAGDGIYVTGTLGDAGLALDFCHQRVALNETQASAVLRRLQYPAPRIAAGRALVGIAHAAIDISDGLAADLGHILERSGKGALIEAGRLPLSSAMVAATTREQSWHYALSAGDDYELCFTAPEGAEAQLQAALAQVDVACVRIGVVREAPGLAVTDADGRVLSLNRPGYDHFR